MSTEENMVNIVWKIVSQILIDKTLTNMDKLTLIEK